MNIQEEFQMMDCEQNVKNNFSHILLNTITGEIKKYEKPKPKYSHMSTNDYGTFTLFLFSRDEEIFPSIKPSSVTRLMFLSTYLGYDGYLKANERNDSYLTKSNMNKLLKLENTEFYVFYNEMIENDIFKEKEGKVFLNNKVFRKGRIKRRSKNLNNAGIRICAKGVRQLYNESDSRYHKTLSYLFKLLPYVNFKYNIICENPTEKEVELIKPLTFTQVCKRLEIEKENTTRFKTNLLKICIGEQSVVRLVELWNKNNNEMVKNIFINPIVYFAGDDYKNVEILGTFK